MTVLARCWKSPEIVQIELTVVILMLAAVLLRNIRIGGAHAADKIEQALKDFNEATDETLLTTNP